MKINISENNTLRRGLLFLALGLSSSLATAHSPAKPVPFCQLAKLTNEECAAYQGFQADADIVRLQHLSYWTRMIYAYKEKTGKFPFEGETKQPITIEIATPQQQKTINRPPYVSKPTHTVADLVRALTLVAPDKEFYELYDPQYSPDVKPNFYIYMIDGDTFFFAVHTHQPYPFARKVSDDYYKVEVSNVYDPSTPHILRPDMLFGSPEYQLATNATLQKPNFFEQRQQLNKHASQTLSSEIK